MRQVVGCLVCVMPREMRQLEMPRGIRCDSSKSSPVQLPVLVCFLHSEHNKTSVGMVSGFGWSSSSSWFRATFIMMHDDDIAQEDKERGEKSREKVFLRTGRRESCALCSDY